MQIAAMTAIGTIAMLAEFSRMESDKTQSETIAAHE
jgi:hypothetical protein